MKINGVDYDLKRLGSLVVLTARRPKTKEEFEKAVISQWFLSKKCCGADVSVLSYEERTMFDQKWSLVFTLDSFNTYVPMYSCGSDVYPFLDDKEKMDDFYRLTKEEFLESYSYLTEEEYEVTELAIKLRNSKSF